MTLLDASGSGLFSRSSQITHVLGQFFKIIAGSAGILILAVWAFIAVIVRAVYVAVIHRSPLRGFYSWLRLSAYGIGLVLALMFMLVTSVLFSIAWFKLLFAAFLITVVVAFLARETFMFLIFKRFGKYLFYFATLREMHQVIVQNGNEETAP